MSASTSTDPDDPFTLQYAATHPFQGIPTSTTSTDTVTITVHTPHHPTSHIESLLVPIQALTDNLTTEHIFHHPLPPTWTFATTPPHLTLTHPYGSAIDDEWLLTSLALLISTTHPSTYLHVTDSSDDEFLLVEAAHALPRWLTPETSPFRPWLHKGKLYIIPQPPGAGRKPPALTLEAALEFLRNTPVAEGALYRNKMLETEALQRARAFPKQIPELLHHTVLTLPRTVASVLHHAPKCVSGAAEAFCARDPVAMRCLTAKEARFPWIDLVQTGVVMSKLQYAQTRAQRWKPVSSYPGEEEDMGVKLCAGLEMLCAEKNGKLFFGEEQGNIVEMVKQAMEKPLLTDAEIAGMEKKEDGTDWMNVAFEEFDAGLKGGKEGVGMQDKDQEEKIQRIVERFEKFLNDDAAGVEGAELNSDDDMSETDSDDEDDDADIDFDEEEFTKMMRLMMGMPPEEGEGEEIQTGPPKQESRLQPVEEEDSEDEEKAIREMQDAVAAELKEAGVLHTTSGPKEKKITGGEEEEEHDIDEDEEVHIDYALVKNMLESFKAQGGVAGPTGNLLAAMGLQLPRDEDEGEDWKKEQAEGEEEEYVGKGKGKAEQIDGK